MWYGMILVVYVMGGLWDMIENYNLDVNNGEGSGMGWIFLLLLKDVMVNSLWGVIFVYWNDKEGWVWM